MHPNEPREAGFSLTELMIAMVVTLIIGGSIVGLLGTGNTGFQKDPERTDRQQNIRIAMDLIQRDIQAAGMSMEDFGQAFRDQLNNTSTIASVINVGEQADALAIWGDDGSCPKIFTKPGSCPGPDCARDGSNIVGASPIPSCYRDDEFLLLKYPGGASKWGFGHNVHSKDKINFPQGQQPNDSEVRQSPRDLCLPSCPGGQVPNQIVRLMYIRYEVRLCEAGGTLPCLWRSDTGGTGTDGNLHLPPAEVAEGNWQMVARGVEDLQVRYRTANGWFDNAGTVVDGDYTTIVQEAQITLSARTVSNNMLGPGLPQRGQLTTLMTPRAALFALQNAPPGQEWR